MTKRITLRRPDDWHLHVRDGSVLEAVLPYTAQHFERAIIMPNLTPPVVRHQEATSYRARIKSIATAAGWPSFEPLMTLRRMSVRGSKVESLQQLNSILLAQRQIRMQVLKILKRYTQY